MQLERTRQVVQEALWACRRVQNPGDAASRAQYAGRRAHRVKVRLGGAGDRADAESGCRELPNSNPPFTKHRQWALGAAGAGAGAVGENDAAAEAMGESSPVQRALRVACRYQLGMQTIRRNRQCVQCAWNCSVQPGGTTGRSLGLTFVCMGGRQRQCVCVCADRDAFGRRNGGPRYCGRTARKRR